MTRFVSYLLCALFFASTAQALQVEIVPKELTVRAEVVGIKAEVNGVAALVFTGEAAEKLAELAGVAFDSATQMIVCTGEEVFALLDEVLGHAQAAGEVVVAVTSELAEKAFALVAQALEEGHAVVHCVVGHASAAAEKALEVAKWAYDHAVTVVTDAATEVCTLAHATAEGLFDLSCSFLDFLSFPFLSCE